MACNQAAAACCCLGEVASSTRYTRPLKQNTTTKHHLNASTFAFQRSPQAEFGHSCCNEGSAQHTCCAYTASTASTAAQRPHWHWWHPLTPTSTLTPLPCNHANTASSLHNPEVPYGKGGAGVQAAQGPPEVDAGVLGHVDLAGAAGGVAVAAAGRQLDVLQRARRQLRVAHAAVARHAYSGTQGSSPPAQHLWACTGVYTLKPTSSVHETTPCMTAVAMPRTKALPRCRPDSYSTAQCAVWQTWQLALSLTAMMPCLMGHCSTKADAGMPPNPLGAV